MDSIRALLKDLSDRLEKFERGFIIKRLTIPPNDTGSFVPKVVTSDPGSPVNNEVWINSTSNQLKWNKAGSIKTVTLS